MFAVNIILKSASKHVTEILFICIWRIINHLFYTLKYWIWMKNISYTAYTDFVRSKGAKRLWKNPHLLKFHKYSENETPAKFKKLNLTGIFTICGYWKYLVIQINKMGTALISKHIDWTWSFTKLSNILKLTYHQISHI